MSPQQLQCPLNEGHCDQLNQVLQAVTVAEQYCAKCEAANIDMGQYRAKLAEIKGIASGIKAQFFPHRS